MASPLQHEIFLSIVASYNIVQHNPNYGNL